MAAVWAAGPLPMMQRRVWRVLRSSMAGENTPMEVVAEEREAAAADVVAKNPTNLRALLRKPRQPFTIPVNRTPSAPSTLSLFSKLYFFLKKK